MAITRPHFYLPVVDTSGDIELDYQVRFLQPGSTTQVTNTLYAARTGNTTVTQPFAVPNGVVDIYFDAPCTVRIGVTPAGQNEFYIEDVDILPVSAQVAVADSALEITGTPQPGYQLEATSSNTAAWVPGITGSSSGGSTGTSGGGTGFITDNVGDMRVGTGSAVSGGDSLAVGVNAVATGASSIAVGQGASATGNQSIALGDGAAVSQDFTAALKAAVVRIGPSPSGVVTTALELFDSSGAAWYLSVDTLGRLITSNTPPSS